MKLSIVVPVFNEEERLPERGKPYVEALARYVPDYELILVDDGSTDRTLRVIEEWSRENPRVRPIHFEKNRGRGFGMREGMRAAYGDYVLETDADFPVSPDHIQTFLRFLEIHPEYGMAIGSRGRPDSTFLAKQPFMRVFAGKAFHIMFWLLFGIRSKDVMCGFKMFRRENAEHLSKRLYDDRYLAAAEIVLAARRLGYSVKELPVAWKDDRRSKVRIVQDTFRTVAGLVAMRRRDWNGWYGKTAENVEGAQGRLTFDAAKRNVKKLYRGFGWPSLFVKIRFITAPYRRLEQLIGREGMIIDLGCGYGVFSNLLGMRSADRKVVGMDFDADKMKYADRGIRNVSFITGDITKVSLRDADYILLIHVLHHLDSYEAQEKLIAACVAKLKQGGKLIIAEIDAVPRMKFFLTQIADHVLYPGDTIYYRFPDGMANLLKKFPVTVERQRMHEKTPFSHVTYICTKTA